MDPRLRHLDQGQLQAADRMKLGQMLELADRSLWEKRCQSTPFFPPYLLKLAEDILKGLADLHYVFDGGYEGAERKRITFCPPFIKASPGQGLTVLKVSARDKQKTFEHRDLMGAVLGLGLDRGLLGDIRLLGPGQAALLIQADMAPFVKDHLQAAGRVCLSLEELNHFPDHELSYQEKVILVSSLRLDSIVASAFKLSRSKADQAIGSGQVKVGGRVEKKGQVKLDMDQSLSLRGRGRLQLDTLLSVSKKGKFRIRILSYR